jgi:hypothetical protein
LEALALASEKVQRALDGGSQKGDRRARPAGKSGGMMRLAILALALLLSACGLKPMYAAGQAALSRRALPESKSHRSRESRAG